MRGLDTPPDPTRLSRRDGPSAFAASCSNPMLLPPVDSSIPMSALRCFQQVAHLCGNRATPLPSAMSALRPRTRRWRNRRVVGSGKSPWRHPFRINCDSQERDCGHRAGAAGPHPSRLRQIAWPEASEKGVKPCQEARFASPPPLPLASAPPRLLPRPPPSACAVAPPVRGRGS